MFIYECNWTLSIKIPLKQQQQQQKLSQQTDKIMLIFFNVFHFFLSLSSACQCISNSCYLRKRKRKQKTEQNTQHTLAYTQTDQRFGHCIFLMDNCTAGYGLLYATKQKKTTKTKKASESFITVILFLAILLMHNRLAYDTQTTHQPTNWYGFFSLDV